MDVNFTGTVVFNGQMQDIFELKQLIRRETDLNFSEAMRKIVKKAIKDKSWMME